MPWTKQCDCTNFMPDDYDQCDLCLLADYTLLDKRRLDSSDLRGLGPYRIDEDAVVEALRKAERTEKWTT